jgi:HPt (histidine-containing phosphotransfer) domain-containing protein
MGTEKIINLDNLHDICGGEDIFTIEIIDLFLAQANENVVEIETAFLDNNIEMLKKKAHKLKSSACIFGIEKLTELLLLIETNGLVNLTMTERKTIITQIKDTTEEACEELKIERKNYP